MRRSGYGNVLDISLWRRCANVLELSQTYDEGWIVRKIIWWVYKWWNDIVVGWKRWNWRRQLRLAEPDPDSLVAACVPWVFIVRSQWKAEELMERTILLLGRLDVWTVTVAQCFSKRETRNGHHNRWYAHKFGWNIKQALEKILGQIWVFVEWWDPAKLKLLRVLTRRGQKQKVAGSETKCNICRDVQKTGSDIHCGTTWSVCSVHLLRSEKNVRLLHCRDLRWL